MKLTGYLKGKGKLGSMIVSTVYGETIARDYQPNVGNPSTVGQVNQRSRLKLASQLAAAMSNVIVIPRDGLKSSRNLFIKKNMGSIIGNNGVAQVSYENLQITNGNTGLPTLHVSRAQAEGLSIELAESAAAQCDRVVYSVFKKTAEETLQFQGSVIAAAAGADGKFAATMDFIDGELVVYGYGMKDNNAQATAKYGDYHVQSGEDIAKLVMSRTIKASDYAFTRTRGTTLFSNENETTQLAENEVMVYITASGPGSVAGAGFSNGRKVVTIGQSVTLTATPNENCNFVGWRNNGGSTNFSAENPLTLTINEQRDIIAVFNDPNSSSGSGDEGYN